MLYYFFVVPEPSYNGHKILILFRYLIPLAAVYFQQLFELIIPTSQVRTEQQKYKTLVPWCRETQSS